MATDQVPTASALKDIYPEDAVNSQKERWENLLEHFELQFSRAASFVSRSPGRVNIIGEHIDYSLYEVLPMAVTADVLLAISLKTDQEHKAVRIANVDSNYRTSEFSVPKHGDVEIDRSTHDWASYFKAGLIGATGLLRKKKNDPTFASVGMDVMMDGIVPQGGGLSSSAAFVCASALAVLKANGEEVVDKTELTELAIVCEREVGVNSGGMDQAASVFPVRGSAIYVSFVPSLRVRPVTFPNTNPEFAFLIAQSFVTSDKAVTAPKCYNLRVVEDSMAALFLSKILKLSTPLPEDAGPLGVSLRGFHDVYFQEKEGVTDNSNASVQEFREQLGKLIQLVEDYITQEDGYTREQLSEILGMSNAEIESKFMTKYKVQADKFKLRQRALHVFTEARRVGDFYKLLEDASSKGSVGEDVLIQLGDLMNQTQDSCRDVYECSCPELDELCAIARKAGSYGSRLTGAGWGGCCVHLVPKDKVDAVQEAWISNYYKKKWPDITQKKLEEAIVVSKPGSGSTVYKVVDGSIA